MDKRQLGFSDLLFKVQVCWSLQESSGVQVGVGPPCTVGFHAMFSPTERHLPPTSTHWHQWLSQWLLPSCSLVFLMISVLAFSFLNPWLVNDAISSTLFTPPALPLIQLWGCSHSCASSQDPGQQCLIRASSYGMVGSSWKDCGKGVSHMVKSLHRVHLPPLFTSTNQRVLCLSHYIFFHWQGDFPHSHLALVDKSWRGMDLLKH